MTVNAFPFIVLGAPFVFLTIDFTVFLNAVIFGFKVLFISKITFPNASALCTTLRLRANLTPPLNLRYFLAPSSDSVTTSVVKSPNLKAI